MRKNGITLVLVLLFVLGMGMLIYPSISNYWNMSNQSKLIVSYDNNAEGLESQEQKRLLEEARTYNKELSEKGISWKLSDAEKIEYEKMLRMADSEIMSYIDIPRIDCKLPIYHGTDTPNLQSGAGHLMGSSLPVGGKGSHCVIAGHRGLPNSILFTNLDKLTEGDVFYLYTMGEKLAYEVDQIRIVEPTDFSYLQIEEGEDLCTLVTCTPKDVNTHRLLVRGHRISTLEDTIQITDEANTKSTALVALFISVPLLFVALLAMYIKNRLLYHKKQVFRC